MMNEPIAHPILHRTPEKYRMREGLGLPLTDNAALQQFEMSITVPLPEDSGYEFANDNVRKLVNI
jgi:hypothetical protein